MLNYFILYIDDKKGFVMKFTLLVDNIKCGGCASHIKEKVAGLEGIKTVEVDVEVGKITGEMVTNVLDSIKKTLEKLGYPESGTQDGLEALGSKAKSYVSCAIGKINKE